MLLVQQDPLDVCATLFLVHSRKYCDCFVSSFIKMILNSSVMSFLCWYSEPLSQLS